MSKTIEVSLCDACPHYDFGVWLCRRKSKRPFGPTEENEPKNITIPSWCPLPDSKEQGWQDIETAPKGGGAELVTAPEWVEPPPVLLLFQNGKQVVCCWDWYYAESGHGYQEGLTAWVEPTSGEQIALIYGNPIGWRSLPSPPQEDK